MDFNRNSAVQDEFKRIDDALSIVKGLGLSAENSVIVGSTALFLQGAIVRSAVSPASDLDVLVYDPDIYDAAKKKWGAYGGAFPDSPGDVVRIDVAEAGDGLSRIDGVRQIELMDIWPVPVFSKDYIFKRSICVEDVRVMRTDDAFFSLQYFGRFKDRAKLSYLDGFYSLDP